MDGRTTSGQTSSSSERPGVRQSTDRNSRPVPRFHNRRRFHPFVDVLNGGWNLPEAHLWPEDMPEVPLAALLQRWHRRAPTAQVCERAEREWRRKCRGDGDAAISPAGQYSGGQALPRVPTTPGPAARALPGAGLWDCALTERLGHK